MDTLIFGPGDVDLARSPLRRHDLPDTFVLGAFNPGLTRLPDGRLLLMVRVAEALREPAWEDRVHCIRWRADAGGRYDCPGYPLAGMSREDPRVFDFPRGGRAEDFSTYATIGLTSLSWLLPVILSGDGARVEEVCYDLAIEPRSADQAYGVEDPRISRIDGSYYMTVCSVSDRRLGTSLYRSTDALTWEHHGLVLDHQNKDMLLFEGRGAAGEYLALTRPQGDVYLAPEPGSTVRTGPAIHLASSPDALHWRPRGAPVLRPQRGGAVKLGGGTPPIRTDAGWLMLYHAVHAGGDVGRYQTYWALLDADEPERVLHRAPAPVLSANPTLTEALAAQVYLNDVVFTTGLVADGDDYLIASGEADLACRLTRLPKATFT